MSRVSLYLLPGSPPGSSHPLANAVL
jgi:hypothetical protein